MKSSSAPTLRKNESRASSKKIAYYLVLESPVKPTEQHRATLPFDYEEDQTGRIFCRPVVASTISHDVVGLIEFAKGFGMKPWIFVRKANIEEKFKTTFAT